MYFCVSASGEGHMLGNIVGEDALKDWGKEEVAGQGVCVSVRVYSVVREGINFGGVKNQDGHLPRCINYGCG